MKRLAYILLLAVVACRTTEERPSAPSTVKAAPAQGYFVALAADGEAKTFYQRLYTLVDAYNRRLAREAGTLPAYSEAFATDGHTRLGDGASEIECDREKCLVKLTGRTLASRDPASLPGQL